MQKKQSAEPKQLSAEEIKNKQYWYKGQIHKSRYIFDKEKLWNLSGEEQIKRFNSLIEKGIIKEATSSEITVALNPKKLEIQKKQPTEPKQLSAEEIKNKQYWYKGQIHKSRYIFDKEKLWDFSGKEQIKRFSSLIEKGIIKEAIRNETEAILSKNVASHSEQVEKIVTESPTLLKPEEVSKLQEEQILNSSWFETIAEVFLFYLSVKKTSLLTIFSFKSEKQRQRERLHSLINNYLKSNPSNKELLLMNQWNQDDKLLTLMNRYSGRKPKTKILDPKPNPQPKYSYFRTTYCWNCKRAINTDTHGKCSKCNWIVCSCGACSFKCST